MNLVTILLAYVLNMRSEREFCDVSKVFFFENNFWRGDQEQQKTDNGYLCKVKFHVERDSDSIASFNYYSETCYSLKTTNLGYFVLRYWSFEKDITAFLNEPEINQFVLKFDFFFADKPIGYLNYLEEYEGEIQNYENYKVPEKISENVINLRSDGVDIRMKHVKEKCVIFPSLNLLKFNKYIKIVGEDKLKEKLFEIEKNAVFKFNSFKDHSECYESLGEFIKDLCYLRLFKDNDYELCSAEMSFNMKNIMKVSQFRKLLYEKFIEKLKKLKNNETYKIWLRLFDDCYEYLEIMMMNNRIFLPIEGKYDIDFAIEQFSDLIYESVKRIQDKYALTVYEDNPVIFSEMVNDILRIDLKKLQTRIAQDFCESKYNLNYFSKFLGKKVETFDDCIKVDMIVCDYYNMFVYIINVYNESYIKNKDSYDLYSYISPIFIDNYNLRIVDGIKICFKCPDEFGYIKGFDGKGGEVTMVQNSDYFIGVFGVVYCPSEVLKMKKIKEIEVISSEFGVNSKKFKLHKYLSN